MTTVLIGNPGAFVVGGCVYRSMVHVAHLQSVALLARAATFVDGGPTFTGFDYMHTSDLHRGRCQWLQRQIDDKSLQWAISVDSDSSFSSDELLATMKWVVGNVAIGVVPMLIGGTNELNVNLEGMEGETRMNAEMVRSRLERNESAEVSSGGFGVAVFNLPWFRKWWPRPLPEVDNSGLNCNCRANGPLHVEPNDERDVVHAARLVVGEDIALCQAVRRRRGHIRALRVTSSHISLVPHAPELRW